MLKKAVGLVTTDVTSHKLTQLDEKTVADLEGLLSDWINTVESNIVDNACDRFVDKNYSTHYKLVPIQKLCVWRHCKSLLADNVMDRCYRAELTKVPMVQWHGAPAIGIPLCACFFLAMPSCSSCEATRPILTCMFSSDVAETNFSRPRPGPKTRGPRPRPRPVSRDRLETKKRPVFKTLSLTVSYILC